MRKRLAVVCIVMLSWLLFAGMPVRAEAEPASQEAFLECLRDAISTDTWEEEYDLIRGFDRADFGNKYLNETAGLYFQALGLMKDVPPQRYASRTDKAKDLAGRLLYCTALLDLSDEYGLELSEEERETLETFLEEYVPEEEKKKEEEGEVRETFDYSFAGHTFRIPSSLKFDESISDEDTRYFFPAEEPDVMLMFMRGDAGFDASKTGFTMNTPMVREKFLEGILEPLGAEEAETVEPYALGEIDALHIIASATLDGETLPLDIVAFLEGEDVIAVCLGQATGRQEDLTPDFYRMLDTMDQTEPEETDVQEAAAGSMTAIASAKRHDTAEDAVQAFLDALKGFDAVQISDYYAEEGLEAPFEPEEFQEELLASFGELEGVSAEELEKLVHTVFDYDVEIVSAEEKDGMAEVTVRIFHVDYREHAGKLLGDAMGSAITAYISNPGMSEEEMTAIVVKSIAESMDVIKDEEKTMSTDVVIPCERIGDEWHAEFGDDLLEAMTGNFETIFDEMDF